MPIGGLGYQAGKAGFLGAAKKAGRSLTSGVGGAYRAAGQYAMARGGGTPSIQMMGPSTIPTKASVRFGYRNTASGKPIVTFRGPSAAGTKPRGRLIANQRPDNAWLMAGRTLNKLGKTMQDPNGSMAAKAIGMYGAYQTAALIPGSGDQRFAAF